MLVVRSGMPKPRTRHKLQINTKKAASKKDRIIASDKIARLNDWVFCKI